MARLSKQELASLDLEVLRSVSHRNMSATYVLRNSLDWPGEPWHRKGLTTAMVLRSCRRLEKRRLISEYLASAYVTMLSWQITDSGREAISAHAEATYGPR